MHGADALLHHHLLEVIGKRIVVASVVVFRRHVVPGNDVTREATLLSFLRTEQAFLYHTVAKRRPHCHPVVNFVAAVFGIGFGVVRQFPEDIVSDHAARSVCYQQDLVAAIHRRTELVPQPLAGLGSIVFVLEVSREILRQPADDRHAKAHCAQKWRADVHEKLG